MPPCHTHSHLLLRVVEEEKMQLVDADNNLLTDVTRVVRGKVSCTQHGYWQAISNQPCNAHVLQGYRYPDIRHRFHWKGKAYLLEGVPCMTDDSKLRQRA